MTGMDWIDIKCRIVKDDPREAAILVTQAGEGGKKSRRVWLPRKLIRIYGNGLVAMPEYLAHRKALK